MLRLLLALVFAFPFWAFSQTGKPDSAPPRQDSEGAKATAGKSINPLPQSSIVNPKSSITRAVVIGISDYQDPAIPDLRFADRDAEAFANFLRSPAGGSLNDIQITLLTNAQATTARFSAALDWLIEQSREGDQAIIYFSGHGDVETKTVMNLGFLLTYSTPPTNYIAGAFPLFYLQSVITTLSQKNVKVLMISDACHAGKLAGSDYGGPQATAFNLAKQFANELKMMSCQPDEFSIEGEQWGGGRGAFSWHLVEGLTGLADRNADQKVQLLEIEDYLEDILPKETAPQSQIPFTTGSKSSVIGHVDLASLAQLKSRKATEQPQLAKIVTKGFEEMALTNADSSIQELYAAFLAAIENGKLLEPPGQSANDYYQRLIREESLASLHGIMKRNLAAALHDKAQYALNRYLKTDSDELSRRYKLDSNYFKYPEYLYRAADLLGEGHYMYQNLRAKQFYFEGLLVRLRRDQLWRGNSIPYGGTEFRSMTEESLNTQRKALALEDRAAFIYHEIAILSDNLGKTDTALVYYQKSAALSPEWVLTVEHLGNVQKSLGQFEAAIDTYKKVLKNAAGRLQIYSDIAMAYEQLHRYGEARSWYEKGIEADSNYAFNYQMLGWHYNRLSDFQKAEACFRKSEQLDLALGNPKPQLSTDLISVFLCQHKNQEVLDLIEPHLAFIDSVPGGEWHLISYGLAKIELGQGEEGLALLHKAAVLNAKSNYPAPGSFDLYIGQGYLKLQRYEEAERYFTRAFEEIKTLEKSQQPNWLFELAWKPAFEHETEIALQWLEIILEAGYDDYERLQLDLEMARLHSHPEFHALMKKHFPDQVKDE